MSQAEARRDDMGDAAFPTEADAPVLASCARGDPLSLRWFVVHYQPLVFAYLSRTLGHGAHVEDLAQDVFLRAFRAIGQFEPRASSRCSTWLLTIAANAAVDFRRRRREVLRDADIEPDLVDFATPETEHYRGEIGAALQRAAALLSDEQCDAFVLAEFHDLSMEEMAVVTGVPVGTIKARLSRARARLRELLGEMWEERR
jgi:RNA polymerase sigma-70 factor (ECF subfamily)